jgi:hypothetical protein
LEENHGNCVDDLTKKSAADDVSGATVSPDTPNESQTVMDLRESKSHGETANKITLEESERRQTLVNHQSFWT